MNESMKTLSLIIALLVLIELWSMDVYVKRALRGKQCEDMQHELVRG